MKTASTKKNRTATKTTDPTATDIRHAATAALENVEILRAAFDSFALDNLGPLGIDESEYGIASTRAGAAIADLKNILNLVRVDDAVRP